MRGGDSDGGFSLRTVPGAPIDVKGEARDGRVRLTWIEPESDGGSPITDSIVQASTDAGARWTTLADGVSADNVAEIAGLENGTSYVFRVAAVNAVGAGTASAMPAGVTPRAVPASPDVPGSVSGTVGSSDPAAAAAVTPSLLPRSVGTFTPVSPAPVILPPHSPAPSPSEADRASPDDAPRAADSADDASGGSVDATAQNAGSGSADNSIAAVVDTIVIPLAVAEENAPQLLSSDPVAPPPSTVQSEPSLPAVATFSTTGDESGPIISTGDQGLSVVRTGPEQAADPTVVPVAPPAPPTTTALANVHQEAAEATAARTNGTVTAGTTMASDVPTTAAGSSGRGRSGGAASEPATGGSPAADGDGSSGDVLEGPPGAESTADSTES